ncbi:hypothetical protein ACTXT7_007020 [Hymenolepis weldensis]
MLKSGSTEDGKFTYVYAGEITGKERNTICGIQAISVGPHYQLSMRHGDLSHIFNKLSRLYAFCFLADLDLA